TPAADDLMVVWRGRKRSRRAGALDSRPVPPAQRRQVLSYPVAVPRALPPPPGERRATRPTRTYRHPGAAAPKGSRRAPRVRKSPRNSASRTEPITPNECDIDPNARTTTLAEIASEYGEAQVRKLVRLYIEWRREQN